MTVLFVPLDPLRDSRHRSAAAARELADWLQYLELGNKAARTLDSYERYAAGLLRAFPTTEFAEFTDGDLGHYLTKHPPKSRHIVKACLNNWFRWGYKTKRIPGNPVDLLPEIRYKRALDYDIFDVAEVEALCALPMPDGPLLSLMLWAGLRRSECIHLTGKRLDLNLDDPQVIVKEGAKGGRTRLVPMADRLVTACADLILLEGIGPDDYLWYTNPGGHGPRRSKPASNTRFDEWWGKCCDDAGVRRRRPHLTRHTFATMARRSGVEMEELSKHLGHAHASTTSDTYVHVDLAASRRRFRELVG